MVLHKVDAVALSVLQVLGIAVVLWTVDDDGISAWLDLHDLSLNHCH